ncbi:MAG TPA: substrate-binding domain-containing protein [Usitatibacter sp.]|nr:substrate-binding domain-containing protein [Usitatibacter sp.]
MKLRFVSAGAAQALVANEARREGIEVQGIFGAVGAMREKYLEGEPCDIVILTRKLIDELAAQGRVVAQSTVDLGAVPTSIAVRASDPAPDVSDEDSLRAALLEADAIYFPDPAKATAGIHFRQVLERLGIDGKVRDRIRNFPNGAASMRAMAEAHGHPIGCTQATEIRATPGVRLVAPLPKGYALVTVYSGAVDAQAADRDSAARFLARLSGALA